jgi:hypothetical protein
MLQFFTDFFQADTTKVLWAFILADLVLGIAAAIKLGVFDFGHVADFYRVKVVPFVLGYLLVYTFGVFGMAALFGALWGNITAVAGAGVAVLNLGADIMRHLSDLSGNSAPPTTTVTVKPPATVEVK